MAQNEWQHAEAITAQLATARAEVAALDGERGLVALDCRALDDGTIAVGDEVSLEGAA